MKKEWGDPKQGKEFDTCKACHGRGIVINGKGEAQVCPLCLGSGDEDRPKENIPRWEW
jgi:DnaJ-class molecular chaperone